MLNKTGKLLYVILGFLTLLLGVIGIFLPILPTTPFLLLSGFLFSKGSDRLHKWLLNLPKIGNIIKNWEQHKVISPRAKIMATLLITILFSYTLIFVNVVIWIKIIVSISGACVIAFILSRKSYPTSSLK